MKHLRGRYKVMESFPPTPISDKITICILHQFVPETSMTSQNQRWSKEPPKWRFFVSQFMEDDCVKQVSMFTHWRYARLTNQGLDCSYLIREDNGEFEIRVYFSSKVIPNLSITCWDHPHCSETFWIRIFLRFHHLKTDCNRQKVGVIKCSSHKPITREVQSINKKNPRESCPGQSLVDVGATRSNDPT